MPGPTATIYLPYSSRVLVQAFVNGAWIQRFTIMLPTASAVPVVITGSGYYDSPAGSTVIDTPENGP